MRIAVVTLFAGMLALPASGQKLDLKLDAVAARASSKAEVDLDPAALKMAAQMMGSKADKGGKASFGELLSGVQEIHVRNYEFEKPGAYTDKDLEPLRRQVTGNAAWSRILSVKEKDESTEVYVQSQGEKPGSCLVMAAEAKELSVIYVLGTLTLAQMKELVASNVVYNLAALAQEAPK